MSGTVGWLRLAVLLGTFVAALGLASHAGLADLKVGIDSGVNPQATGIPPGALPRRLVLGQDILFNERITTEASGQTQVLFVDESTLSIGPNADMVIDQFVYDPNRGTGKMAASLTRGVFRFVGGKLSKQENATSFRTPAATIGIRGGVMLVDQASTGALTVIFVYGKGVTVTGLNGVSQTIFRPGFEVTVSRPGASPSDPAPAPPGAAAAMLAQLDGRAGASGGAAMVPTEVMVAQSGLSNVISSNINASIEAAEKNQPLAPQPESVTPVVTQTELNNQNVQISGFTATTATGETVSFNQLLSNPTAATTQTASTTPSTPTIPSTPPLVTPPPPVTPPPVTPTPTPPVTQTPPPVTPPPVTPPTVTLTNVAGGYYDTGTRGTATGFSGSLSPYAGANAINGAFTATGAFGTVSFPLFAGTQTLAASGSGTSSPLGPVTGTTYVAPDDSFFYANLTPVNQPSQREFIYGGTPVNAAFYTATSKTPSYLAFNVQPDAALQSNIPFIRLPAGGSLAASAYTSPLILATPLNATFSTDTGGTKALQASLAVVGSGTGQSSVIVVMVGNVFDASLNGTSPARPILNGIVHGSYLANAAGQPTRIYSPYVTPADANGNSFYGTSTISGFAVTNGNCCAAGQIPSQAFETNTANQAVTNYQFAQPATATTVPASISGASQTTRQLTGYFGGIMTKEPSSGAAANPIPYALAGTATINTNAGNLQVRANLAGSDPFASTSNSGISSVNLGYGSLSTGATNARVAFVNDNLYAAFENPSNPSTVNGVTVPVNDSNTGSNIYFVTQAAAPPPATLLSNGLCSTCQYLQWGYWGGQLDTPASGETPARTDVGHINFWVAGTPVTSVADISSLKASAFTGTYNGNLIGTVLNSGAQYLASGGLKAVYNFGTGAGSFSVVNYDGNSFTESGISGIGLTGSSYTFGIKHVPGVSGVVSGSFYGPMAAETGGNFAFTAGSTYSTSGIFAAKR